jgi:hypothetical protein
MNRGYAELTSSAMSDPPRGPFGAAAPQPSSGEPVARPTTGSTGNDKVDALLSLFPGPVTLWPDRVRILRGLALSFIFIAIAAADVLPSIIAKHKIFYLVIFGGWALFIAVRLLPGAFKLTLDKDGFERVSLFLTFRRPWHRTDTMRLWRMSHRRIPYGPRMQCVGHDDEGGATNSGKRPLLGRFAALSNSYNLSAKESVSLMSQWRARALAQGGG